MARKRRRGAGQSPNLVQEAVHFHEHFKEILAREKQKNKRLQQKKHKLHKNPED